MFHSRKYLVVASTRQNHDRVSLLYKRGAETMFNGTSMEPVPDLNTTSSMSESEALLPLDVALQLRGGLQGILLVAILIGTGSIIYIHLQRCAHQRLYGPAASGFNHLMMMAVNIGLIVVSIFLLIAITFMNKVPCFAHSIIAASMLTIGGTIFLLRAWLLVAQFARVREQLRWMKHYNMLAEGRTEPPEDKQLTLSTRIDMWITSNPAATSPAVLLPISIIFIALMLTPSVVTGVQNRCDNQLPNNWNICNMVIFVFMAVILALKLRKSIDTIGMRRELEMVAFIFFVAQLCKMATDPIENLLQGDDFLSDDTDQNAMELGFDFWHSLTIETLQILFLIALVTVRPALRLCLLTNTLFSSGSVHQQLHDVLNNKRRKEEFQDFLRREFSIENLTFYDMVAALIRQSEQTVSSTRSNVISELVAKIWAIYNDFVLESGRFQVNLSSDIRHQIDRAVMELESACSYEYINQQVTAIRNCILVYTQAQSSIFNLMATDSLPRFLREKAEERMANTSYGAIVHTGVSTQLNVSIKSIAPIFPASENNTQSFN